MRRETPLTVGAVAVVAAAAVLALLSPGVPAETDPGPVREGDVGIREVTVRPVAVGGETATFAVATRLTHRGGPVENVTVLLRATDTETGFVAASRRLDVGRLAGDREVAVRGRLDLERSGGYRIETVVFRDGRRVAVGGKAVRGLEALDPAYARSPVSFHRFESGMPTVEFSIAGVEGNRTRLSVAAHVTNRGDAPASGYRLVVKARQADSNIVADEASVDIGTLEPGATAAPSATLTVPKGYNYHLDAVIWKDGVVVGTARSAANLAPAETIAEDEQRRTVQVRVSDFTTAEPEPPERPEATSETASAGTPGVGPAGALAAVVLAALLLGRRRR
ncbi:MAG: PGF-CTERM sorting domain-containing protein [Halobacteriaceae archaeon]